MVSVYSDQSQRAAHEEDCQSGVIVHFKMHAKFPEERAHSDSTADLKSIMTEPPSKSDDLEGRKCTSLRTPMTEHIIHTKGPKGWRLIL